MGPGDPNDKVEVHGARGRVPARPLPPAPAVPLRESQAAPPPEFEAFYRAERKKTLAVTAGLIGDWGVAEDVVQESFAEAYRQWTTVGLYSRPDAWVRRVAINKAISRVRRHRIEARVLGRIGLGPAADGDAPIVDAELWAAVRRLSRRQAQVVALTYIEDLTMHQVAEVLGCSRDSVKTHLRRAHERLAREVPDPRSLDGGPTGEGR